MDKEPKKFITAVFGDEAEGIPALIHQVNQSRHQVKQTSSDPKQFLLRHFVRSHVHTIMDLHHAQVIKARRKLGAPEGAFSLHTLWELWTGSTK